MLWFYESAIIDLWELWLFWLVDYWRGWWKRKSYLWLARMSMERKLLQQQLLLVPAPMNTVIPSLKHIDCSGKRCKMYFFSPCWSLLHINNFSSLKDLSPSMSLQLDIAYDKFIRTTSPKHEGIVNEFYSRVLANGDIYRADYEGLYCVNCEEYKVCF